MVALSVDTPWTSPALTVATPLLVLLQLLPDDRTLKESEDRFLALALPRALEEDEIFSGPELEVIRKLLPKKRSSSTKKS